MANRQLSGGLVASEADRALQEQLRQQEQKQTISKISEQARGLINQGKFDKAVELAFKCLQESSDIFGQDSIELMPLYFELADGNLKMKKSQRAESFLIGAQWTLLKHQSGETDKSDNNRETEDMLSKLRSRLLRSFGSLFTEIGNFAEALKSLTENIYLESVDKGPEHYSLSGSYFLMGNIFLKIDRKSEVLSFYNQMNLIWKKFLSNPDAHDAQNVKKVDVEQACNELNEVLLHINKELSEESDMAGDIRQTLDRLYEFIIELDKIARNTGSKNNIHDFDDDEEDEN